MVFSFIDIFWINHTDYSGFIRSRWIKSVTIFIDTLLEYGSHFSNRFPGRWVRFLAWIVPHTNAILNAQGSL